MSKSLLYAANTSTQTIAVGGSVNFGSVIRRYGCNCNLSNGNTVISGNGYYTVDTNLTLTAETAGTLTVTVQKDNITLPGATTSLTVAADSIYSITLPTVVRECGCCNNYSTIKVIITGVAATVSNATITVVKE